MKKIKDTGNPHSVMSVVRNVNEEHQENLTDLERFALWITKHVGTMGFFMLLAFWTVGWLMWNTLAPDPYRFDPFPSFVLWLFISNMIQLFLLPLLMTGQNLQGRHAERRAEIEFEINRKSERILESLLMQSHQQQKQLNKLIKH